MQGKNEIKPALAKDIKNQLLKEAITLHPENNDASKHRPHSY